MGPFTVVIVDDVAIIREVLTELLDTAPDLEVVGGVGDAETAVDLCRRLRPDIAVLDVHMPGGGPTAAARIREVSPDTTLVALTSDSGPGSRRRMAAAGVEVYVVKGGPGSELLTTIRTAVGSATDPPPPDG